MLTLRPWLIGLAIATASAALCPPFAATEVVGHAVRELQPPGAQQSVPVPERRLPLLGAYDVVVVGGGAAGVPAALAAARNGAETALIECYPFLGGTGTMGGVHVFMRTVGAKGIIAEILDRLEREGGRLPGNYAFDPEQYKLLLDDLLRSAGVDLLYRCYAVGAFVEPDRRTGHPTIRGVVVESAGGRQIVRARRVIDCTGDGDIAVAAGAPYKVGRKSDGLTQPGTLMYTLEQIGGKGQRGGWRMPHNQKLVNATRVKLDGTNAEQLTRAELAGRRQMKAQVDKWEREGEYRLLHSGPHFGIRETRRIVGEYILTEQDVQSGRRFPDRIARSSYPIDEHNPTGRPGTRLEKVPPYEIPYRCLVPLGIENLLVAGRCISSDHIAQTSYRVMLVVMQLGQAAGTAAALSLESKATPRELDVAALQQRLTRQGADLGPDPRDLARLDKGATAQADSQYPLDVGHPDTRPELAIDGDDTTRWLSARTPEPHWLIVDLGQPRRFSQVRLSFWPAGGPTWSIADYRLEYETAGQWRALITVQNNQQTQITHSFEPVTARRLRLYVTKGSSRDSIARLAEIEVLP